MKEKILQPIEASRSDEEKMRDKICALFKREIYLPLLKEIGQPHKLKNSTDDLIDAILSGQIEFHHGQFTGKFDASLTRELRSRGAKWDSTHESFRIPLSDLSIEIKNAISQSVAKFNSIAKKVEQKLSELVPAKIAEKLQLNKLFDSTIFRVDKEFEQQIKKIAVAPQLDPERRARIAEEYTKNMQLYIQEWTEKEIIKLRKNVQAHAFQGNRYEGMFKVLQESYGVSRNKAKFLARQETNLLVTKYAQIRYQDAGSDKYIWQCVHNAKDSNPDIHHEGNVRYYHGILDGTRQKWIKPPIVDGDGNRKNPGQDYNCRCKARPIVRF